LAWKAPWTGCFAVLLVQGMPAANAFQFNASRTAATALWPSTEIRLAQGGQFASWGTVSSGYTDGGLAAETGTDAQVWNLRKCSAAGAGTTTACIANNAFLWTATTSPIVSGDVVAWVNKQTGKLYDCASNNGNACSIQPYPPPTGHWGSPYTIKKLSSGGSVESDGTPIYLGDDVYFYGMQSSSWAASHIIDCGSYCYGGNGNTISGSTFTIASSVPTPSPTPAPTPAPTPVSAVGDPHLTNIHGEKFDLMKPGKHRLIHIPRMSVQKKVLLRVDAEAQRVGGQCADIYFQELNITGAWADATKAGGFRYRARDVAPQKNAHWARFGHVQLKVAHGHTRDGVKYLNLYVKSLNRAGFPVGGLLGEDDHSEEEAAPAACTHRLSL